MSKIEIPDLRVSSISRGNTSPIVPDSGQSSPSLWSLTQQQTLHALQCGALQSIETDYAFVEQNGVRFLVRILTNLVRKEKATKKQQQLQNKGKDFNPFLPYEKDLFVSDLSSTHLCLLNKFNVVNHHLLIVTREFEEQENWLNFNDFFALWMGLREIDGLAFFNGGKTAGASQRHKHLQLIPMPLSPEGKAIPMEAILPQTNPDGAKTIADLPFRNGFSPLKLDPSLPPTEAANRLLSCYLMLLDQVGDEQQPRRDRNPIAYNLLITRRWMLLIPRIQENTNSISINALGFAGSLFVKNKSQFDLLKQKGPMTLLQNVGYPSNS